VDLDLDLDLVSLSPLELCLLDLHSPPSSSCLYPNPKYRWPVVVWPQLFASRPRADVLCRCPFSPALIGSNFEEEEKGNRKRGSRKNRLTLTNKRHQSIHRTESEYILIKQLLFISLYGVWWVLVLVRWRRWGHVVKKYCNCTRGK
jgi:hypothetical protein